MDAYIPCEQCRRLVGADERRCPHCGAEVRPEWRDRERQAVEEAFRQAPVPPPMYGPPVWRPSARRGRTIALVLLFVLVAAVAAYWVLK